MKYLFKAKKKLGDTLLCMPSCLQLFRQGHEVWIDCPEEWHSIFSLVSYTRPWIPGHSPIPDQIFDVNTTNFGRCKSTLNNFISDWFKIEGVPNGSTVLFDREIPKPDYGLPKGYTLISPFGYSQAVKTSIECLLEEVKYRLGGSRKDIFCLTDKPRDTNGIPTVTAGRVDHLPHLIAEAGEFFTINSAPAIIAAAVRMRPYFLIAETGYDDEDIAKRINCDGPYRILTDPRTPRTANPSGL